MPATWTPKYAFAVEDTEYSRSLHEDLGTRPIAGEEWVFAPAESHCEAFLYLDNRKEQHSLLDPSELRVRFKDQGKGVYEYWYMFPDAAVGASVFQGLCAAASPWGEVGYPRLVLAGVEYYRRS